MYSRNVYPDESGVSFYYQGTDLGTPWPEEAPIGISMADGFVHIQPTPFSAPGSSETHHLTTNETIYLANLSAGLSYETMIERHPDAFDSAAKRTAITTHMRRKFGIDEGVQDGKALIAGGFYHNIYSIKHPPLLTSIDPKYRQTIVDGNRLIGAVYTAQKACEIIGKNPAQFSILTRNAIEDLELDFIETRPNALFTIIGMGGLLLKLDTKQDLLPQLPPLTDEELRSVFPSKTIQVRPPFGEPGVVINLGNQHPDDTYPDWHRGTVESFEYQGAIYKIGNVERAGLTDQEMAAWVLRWVGLDAGMITSMLGTPLPWERGRAKLIPKRTGESPGRQALSRSVFHAREQGILTPDSDPALRLSKKDRQILLDAADLLGVCDHQHQLARELRARGHAAWEVRALHRRFNITHAGQLALLAEAARHAAQTDPRE